MREKSIKLTDYFQLISTKQQLSYYKIIPHQNTRNYKSVEISKVINKCYKDITKRIYKIEKTWFIEAPTKIGYYIHISKSEGIEFFFV